MLLRPHIIGICLAAALISINASAQTAPAELEVPAITVTGSEDNGDSAISMPVATELSGQRLQHKRQTTVGETLSNEAGVSASQFGTSASRPVIRGQEGDRVRILQNGTGVLDASAASEDHAIAIDPLAIDRMEVIRGPGALLYGTQAVGGAVNLITNRIPEKSADGTHGKTELRGASNAKARSAALVMDSGAGSRWAIHADAALRASDDYSVPGYARTTEKRRTDPLPADEPESPGRVYNSWNRTASGALGASYVFDKGFIGSSFSHFGSRYGTIVERFSTINLSQQRWDLAGERRDLGFIKNARVANTYSHYKHDELEQGGGVGTTFKNDGDELRLDLRHRSVAGYAGTFGAQLNQFTFSAQGGEAFIPSTDNSDAAVFVYEEREQGALRPSIGARLDHAAVKSKDDSKFGVGRARAFDGGSVALGLAYQLSPSNTLSATAAYTERAPNYEELFANGPHAATHIYEVGDAGLGKEQSQSGELSWHLKRGLVDATTTAFVQDYHRYIALSPTGDTDGTTGMAKYRYNAVEARFFGGEFSMRHKMPRPVLGGLLEFELKADVLRGIDRSTGNNLPRLTPVRETLALNYKSDRLQADIELQRSEWQSLTAPNEDQTPGYMLVNLGVDAPMRLASVDCSLFFRLNNAFDAEARNHVSVIKDLAPLPGRNLSAGLQATF